MTFLLSVNMIILDMKDFSSFFTNMDQRSISDDTAFRQKSSCKGSPPSLWDCRDFGLNVILAIRIGVVLKPVHRASVLLVDKVSSN